MYIGSAIKLARENLDLTKKALAEEVGLSPSAITRIENGERSLSLQAVQDIAKALGLKLSQLVLVAESILKPEDEIKELQRDLLFSIQPLLLSQKKRRAPSNLRQSESILKHPLSKPTKKVSHRTAR